MPLETSIWSKPHSAHLDSRACDVHDNCETEIFLGLLFVASSGDGGVFRGFPGSGQVHRWQEARWAREETVLGLLGRCRHGDIRSCTHSWDQPDTVQKVLGAQTMACPASPSSDFVKHKFSFVFKIAPVVLFTTSEADTYRQDVEWRRNKTFISSMSSDPLSYN